MFLAESLNFSNGCENWCSCYLRNHQVIEPRVFIDFFDLNQVVMLNELDALKVLDEPVIFRLLKRLLAHNYHTKNFSSKLLLASPDFTIGAFTQIHWAPYRVKSPKSFIAHGNAISPVDAKAVRFFARWFGNFKTGCLVLVCRDTAVIESLSSLATRWWSNANTKSFFEKVHWEQFRFNTKLINNNIYEPTIIKILSLFGKRII